ncbi:phospholipase D-like domain-containing protein [Cystobacter fuscus]
MLLASAQHRLWLTNACFVPTPATVDTLIHKAKSGVDVRILVPGLEGANTSASVLAAQRSSYERLLENGVRLWEYRRAPLESRTVLVDDHLVAVGSTNLQAHASALLEEGALVVEDGPLAHSLATSFERDLTHAVEIRKEQWRERGWFQRITYRLPLRPRAAADPWTRRTEPCGRKSFLLGQGLFPCPAPQRLELDGASLQHPRHPSCSSDAFMKTARPLCLVTLSALLACNPGSEPPSVVGGSPFIPSPPPPPGTPPSSEQPPPTPPRSNRLRRRTNLRPSPTNSAPSSCPPCRRACRRTSSSSHPA